jgi:hypothetical protein
MESITGRRWLVIKPSFTWLGTRVGLFALSASVCVIGTAIGGPGVAQASPAPRSVLKAVHGGVPSTCSGVSGRSLASALRYKSLPPPTSSTQHEKSGSISGTGTVCIYGAMTSAAQVKNLVIVAYETFSNSLSEAQAVEQIKEGLSKDATPGSKVSYSIGAFDGVDALMGKVSFKEGSVSTTSEFMAAWHGNKACSVVLERVVPKGNLQAALKLAINNSGM